jgi:hypothetical protein
MRRLIILFIIAAALALGFFVPQPSLSETAGKKAKSGTTSTTASGKHIGKAILTTRQSASGSEKGVKAGASGTPSK